MKKSFLALRIFIVVVLSSLVNLGRAQQVDVKWSKYLGGSAEEEFQVNNPNLDFEFEGLVYNGIIYNVGFTKSSDYPVNSGNLTTDSIGNLVVTAIDPNDGEIIWTCVISKSIKNFRFNLPYSFYKNQLYIIYFSGQNDTKIISINLEDGSIEYEHALDINPSNINTIPSLKVDEQNIYFTPIDYGKGKFFIVLDREIGTIKLNFKRGGPSFSLPDGLNKTLIDEDYVYFFTQKIVERTINRSPSMLYKFDKKNLILVDSLLIDVGYTEVGNNQFIFQDKNNLFIKLFAYRDGPYTKGLIIVDKLKWKISKFERNSFNPFLIFDSHLDTLVSLNTNDIITLSNFRYDSVYNSLKIENFISKNTNYTANTHGEQYVISDFKRIGDKLIVLSDSEIFKEGSYSSTDGSGNVNNKNDWCFQIIDLKTGKMCYKNCNYSPQMNSKDGFLRASNTLMFLAIAVSIIDRIIA